MSTSHQKKSSKKPQKKKRTLDRRKTEKLSVEKSESALKRGEGGLGKTRRKGKGTGKEAEYILEILEKVS